MAMGSGSRARDEQVSRIAGKLRLTAPSGSASPTARVGMRNDPYVLSPPLTPDRVAEFEQRHGVRLPEAYRRFLLEIGDGDPGDGGLYSLDQGYGELVDMCDLREDGGIRPPLPDPDEENDATGSPPSAEAEDEVGSPRSHEDDADDADDDVDFLARTSPYRRGETYTWRWWEDNHGPGERLDQLRGTLPVQEGGCSEFYFVVVTGPDAGAIYSANWDGGHGPERVGDDYLTWYEENLDARVLSHAERWDESLPGSEAELVEVLTGDPHEYRRMWAAVSLRKPRRWPVGRGRSERLREWATEVLHQHGALTTDDLARLLDDPEWTVRRQAMYALPDVADPDGTLVAKALFDDEFTVRSMAIDQIVDRDDPALTALLSRALEREDDFSVKMKLELALGMH